MKPDTRRRVRAPRPLPYGDGSTDQAGRTLFCLDMRVVDVAWTQRPLDEIRAGSRGSRLGQLFSGMDLDPRRSLQRNARTLSPARAQQIFDALCEELAEGVLYDVPRAVWQALLPLLMPHGTGESPYPSDGVLPDSGALQGGLVMLCEGRLSAESALVALSQAVYPPLRPGRTGPDSDDGEAVDPILWTDIIAAVMPMLKAVRDQQMALVIEA